jgi:hypothetical protein
MDRRPSITNDVDQAEALLSQVMRERGPRASAVIECVYYAAEPDLMALMRAVARLDPASRLKIMNYARKLAGAQDPAH